MTVWLYISTRSMTCAVAVDDQTQKVVEAPPILRKFLGQDSGNLIGWLAKQPGFQIREIDRPHSGSWAIDCTVR